MRRSPRPFAYLGLGIEMAAPIVLFIWAGYRVDRWLESDPWFLLGGSLLGIVVSLWSLFRVVLRNRSRGESE